MTRESSSEQVGSGYEVISMSSSKGYRVLVTGASGFVGTHVVDQACKAGWDVVAAYHRAPRDGGIDMDICDAAGVSAAFRDTKPTHVINCAAYGVNYSDQDHHRAIAVNLHGALNVLAAAAEHNVQRLVHVGSCFEYGSHDCPIAESTALNPTAIYGATKAAATLLLRERARVAGAPLLIARPFALWGPGEGAHRLIPQVVNACISRKPLKLTSCEVVRDYMYVEDLAACLLRLALVSGEPSGAVVNLASGRGQMLRDFVRDVARLLDGDDLMHFGTLSYRPTEMSCLVADLVVMRRLLGELPETPMVEGVRRMVLQHRNE